MEDCSIMNIANNVMPIDTNLALDQSHDNIVEGNQAVEKLTNLNAFDTISLSNGLGRYGVFEENSSKEEAKFISANTTSIIITQLEKIATNL
jgi:5'-AMP-activated protein kinase catalytic alpha subunit